MELGRAYLALLPRLVDETIHRVHLTFQPPQCSSINAIIIIIARADGSRVSLAFIRLCDSVILSVCPHDNIETPETKIAKLGTGIVHHDTSPTNEY